MDWRRLKPGWSTILVLDKHQVEKSSSVIFMIATLKLRLCRKDNY